MKRSVPAATLAAVVVAGLTATTAPDAAAAPSTVGYTCSSPFGPRQVDHTFDTVLPDPPGVHRLSFGVDSWSTVRLGSAVPGDIAKQAADDGAVTVSVSGTVDFRDSTTAGFPVATFGAVAPLGDQTTATDVPYTAGASRLWLIEPGLREVTAASPTTTFTFRAEDGTVIGEPVTLTCAAPAAPVIDTVRVTSASAVSVTLGDEVRGPEAQQPATFAFGQPVPVRAHVRVLGTRTAAGWVDFTLDGVTRRVAVGADGTAATTLPGPRDRSSTNVVVSPSNYVRAAYVPADPQLYEESAAPLTFVPLAIAGTEPRVRVSGRRTDRRARVRVRVAPEFESTPTGTVRVNLRRLGTRKHWSRTRALRVVEGRSRARVGFGRLSRGRYQVVVKYRGDADHHGSRTVEEFRVRRP